MAIPRGTSQLLTLLLKGKEKRELCSLGDTKYKNSDIANALKRKGKNKVSKIHELDHNDT